jgi:hypothetical protein
VNNAVGAVERRGKPRKEFRNVGEFLRRYEVLYFKIYQALLGFEFEF